MSERRDSVTSSPERPVTAGLRLQSVSKRFGSLPAVADFSLEVQSGETIAVLGPSGCGKSTLLRLVAGLERPSAGAIHLAGRDVTGDPPQRRDIGMVFQDFALFPHLDVAANVAFALVEARWSAAEIRRRTAQLLELVGLTGLAKRRVFELSGGQQQRVALARALAAQPSLLLLDEPLSNLDPDLRGSLVRELRELLASAANMALYVTHDQAEAFALADRVALMRAGRLVRLGEPRQLLRDPGSVWAARFLGYRNVYGAQSEPARRLGQPGGLLVRDDLLAPGGDTPATVIDIERNSRQLLLTLDVPALGARIEWTGFRRELPDGLAPGLELGLTVPPAALVPLADDLDEGSDG